MEGSQAYLRPRPLRRITKQTFAWLPVSHRAIAEEANVEVESGAYAAPESDTHQIDRKLLTLPGKGCSVACLTSSEPLTGALTHHTSRIQS